MEGLVFSIADHILLEILFTACAAFAVVYAFVISTEYWILMRRHADRPMITFSRRKYWDWEAGELAAVSTGFRRSCLATDDALTTAATPRPCGRPCIASLCIVAKRSSYAATIRALRAVWNLCSNHNVYCRRCYDLPMDTWGKFSSEELSLFIFLSSFANSDHSLIYPLLLSI